MFFIQFDDRFPDDFNFRGVMVTVVGNGHGDPSSNPSRGYYLFKFVK